MKWNSLFIIIIYCPALKRVPWTDPTGTRTYLPSKRLPDDRFLGNNIIYIDFKLNEALECFCIVSVSFLSVYDDHHQGKLQMGALRTEIALVT